MIKLSSARSLLSLVVAGVGLVACQPAADTVDQTAEQLSSDGATAISSDDQSTSALTDASFESVTSADPAAAVSALLAAPAAPVDGKCRTRQKDPSEPHTVIITLTDCTGRFGRRHVSGTEIVHFTQGAGGVLHADYSSQNLTVDGRPATHTASADITFAEGARHVTWQGALDTTSELGEAVAHTSDLTIDVDTATHCRTRNGSGHTTIGDRQIDTSIEALVTCRDADGDAGCPTGTVVHTRQPSGKQVTVSFDGTDQATITSAKGITFQAPLTCHE
jgi:hypothetical protein